MVAQIGIRELRDNLTATIRRVRAGETIEVTHRHATVAVISPATKSPLEQLLASGDVVAGGPLVLPARRLPVTGVVNASEALAQDRSNR